MTMIGPNQPKQICPECEGEGTIEMGEYQEWRSISSFAPHIGEYVTVHAWATCDTCAGEGVVTKRYLKELERVGNG